MARSRSSVRGGSGIGSGTSSGRYGRPLSSTATIAWNTHGVTHPASANSVSFGFDMRASLSHRGAPAAVRSRAMTRDVEEAVGTGVTIRFEASKCIHSRGCVLGRPDVFVPNVQGEWIHPDAATVEEVAALAHSCPSGAITYLRRDGGPQEAAPVVDIVRVRRDGPPAITPREDGPLLVTGNLEVVSGTGRTVERCTKTALCRCGGSSNKPYCDGTHKTNGFRASGAR